MESKNAVVLRDLPSLLAPDVSNLHDDCLPAESWASDVLDNDLRSCRDFSAAVRSSVFLRFESEIRFPNSAARIWAVMLSEEPIRTNGCFPWMTVI